ncbi:MAG: serine/threonine-protein kinase [Steroidobacteraceae bacterium]
MSLGRLDTLMRNLVRTTARLGRSTAAANAAPLRQRMPDGGADVLTKPHGAETVDAAETRRREPLIAPRPACSSEAYPDCGQVLNGHYRLESVIGRGAMGQVWRARDLLSEEAGAGQSQLAVKLFLSELEREPHALAIMQRETSRAQKLSHPNIVRVHYFDRDERTGLLFMVMELVDGQPLDRLLREQGISGLPRKDAVRVIRGLTDALAYAHDQGTVHCDLKPANVLVARDGTPKILDFGIAQAVQRVESAGAGGAARPDDAPIVTGYTERYASPQVLENERAEPADDVFALGIVAYEIFTGRYPFDGERAPSVWQRVARPRGPSRREWRAIRRALEFDRAQRWPDAGTFGKAFVGISALQRSLIITVAVLTLAAAALGYRSYRAALPAVPLQQLPPEMQEQVRKALSDGQGALDYLRASHERRGNMLDDAADSFDRADYLHPRDLEAVEGLKAVAALAIEWARSSADRDAAVKELQTLKEHTVQSRFYERYAPLDREIEKLAARERGK